MKKVLLSLLVVVTSFIMIPFVNAEEKVPVYMISKEGCSACHAASEYFKGLEEENPDLFDLVELQVFDSNWNFVSTDLQNMFVAVYEKIGEDTSKAATPTIVIGDYSTIGLPQDTNVIKEEIIKQRDAKKKVDIVKDIAKTLNINIDDIRKQSATETTEEKTTKNDALIIAVILVVLVGGFAGLVIASKK